MRQRHLLISIFLCLCVSGEALAEKSHATIRALLVGCSRYVHLPIRSHLTGPANDVTLFSEVLQSAPFSCPPENIVVLSEQRGEEWQPRREHIVREINRLINTVKPEDQVLILLAGHGSRQPDDNKDERDGWDETFLPADITEWKGTGTATPGAITDDEIHGWLTQLHAKGAFVFLVADCCHSGTLSRACGTVREIDTRELLPKQIVDAVEPLEHTVDRRQEVGLNVTASTENGQPLPGIVALYAVDAGEKEEERHFNGTKYGLLTYATCSALQQSSTRLTYRELAQKVRWFLQGLPVPFYKGPVLDGEDIDREVLGQKVWGGRSTITLEQGERKQLQINLGFLHGLTVGSVLSVYAPHATQDLGEARGFVEVTEVRPLDSVVQPVDFGNKTQVEAANLRVPATCRVEWVDYGELKLNLAVAGMNPDPNTIDAVAPGLFPDLQQQVRAILDRAQTAEDAMFVMGTRGTNPDWWVLVDEKSVFLRQVGDNPNARYRQAAIFGPYPINAALGQDLTDALRRIARVVNLRALAQLSETPVTRSSAAQVSLKLRKDGRVLDLRDGVRLRDGDVVELEIQNEGGLPVDVTVLYVDSAYGIVPFLPRYAGHDNRLLAKGAEQDSLVVNFNVNDETIGWEDVIVIAQIADPTRQSVAYDGLAQSGLLRGNGDGVPPATPLGRLLDLAGFGEGTTRGASPGSPTEGYSISRLTWLVE